MRAMFAFCILIASAFAATNDRLISPLERAAEHADSVQREILDAWPTYDAARIEKAVAALEARAKEPERKDDDDYFVAQGKLEQLLIRRFFETDAPERMPASLAALDHDEVADAAIDAARRFAERHADHSDVQRLIGELYSTKIRGMAGGMTNGPKAKDAIEKSIELDPTNSLALLCQGRMHYHNPSFAGGDKEKALEEFRRVAADTGDLRADLYLARIYRDRSLWPQARFWLGKAKRVAPENPELGVLAADVDSREKAARSAKEGSR